MKREAWERKATARGPRQRFICQTQRQRLSEMDQSDWNRRHIVAVYWWCDCWWKEKDLYSHQPKGAKLTEASSIVRREPPSLDFNLNFSADTVASSGCQRAVALLRQPFHIFVKCFTVVLPITSVISCLFYFEFTGVACILNVCWQDVDTGTKTRGRRQGRCWICTKAVFEQEQNAKQATESSPAERAELKTLAGTTQAALSMWPELKTTYGVFRNSSDPKNPPKK